jgi:telomerase reverse transcriptase
MKRDFNDMYAEGKLRVLPKKGTFRPIITFNRKTSIFGDDSPNHRFQKVTLNQVLSDTQLVLRNMKDLLGVEMGYCVFDNNQIMEKYEQFLARWKKNGKPELKYFTLDIKKCYDSINATRLMGYIQKSTFIDDAYYVVRYNRFYRNKRPLAPGAPFAQSFNYTERITAVSLLQDPIKVT